MHLKLIAVYLKNSQLEYILSVKTYFLQENFNFDFEYLDEKSNFAELHSVEVYPSFYLLKNDKVVSSIRGKIQPEELAQQLLTCNYVEKEKVK